MNRKLTIPILYECPHFILINKPPGVQSQPGDYHTHNKIHVMDQLQRPELRLVHRLDTNVTGGMILAKTKTAARNFHKNLASKRSNQGYFLRRRYIALIDTPNFAVTDDMVMKTEIADKTAETKFKMVDLSFDLQLQQEATKTQKSLAILELITGRKHQIREHLQANLQTACVNDLKYGSSSLIEGTRQIGLHSCWIRTKVGMNDQEFLIPIMFGKELWAQFIDQQGNFVKGIQEQILKF